MTEPNKPAAGGGVLSSLPSTRPQRRSPKRGPAAPTAAAAARRNRPRSAGQTKAVPPPTPRASIAAQGFNAAHGAVDPPSRTDLLGSVVSGAGEIAEIGLAAGRHVLRSIYGRLPRP
jgi:hypothetical protein